MNKSITQYKARGQNSNIENVEMNKIHCIDVVNCEPS